jgi:hypothetical protein
MGNSLVEAEKSSKPKKAKKTPDEILAELEETGIDFSPNGLGPWSHSKLKLLTRCPLKFYLQYILKVPPKTQAEISLVTEVGKAAHKILELHLGGKPLDRAFKLTKEEYAHVIGLDNWDKDVATLEYSIAKFKERIDGLDTEHGVKRLFQEIRIGVDKNWESTGFFSDDVYYRGVIDLVVQLMNGDIIIVDHKTGTSSAMGLRNFKDQLDTYKVLFHHGIEKTSGAQAGIHHIREAEIVLDDYADVKAIEGSLLNRIEFSIEGAIDALKGLGYFKHIAGSTCKYCDYREDCKAGNLKKVEMDSKKWFEIKKE